MKQKMDEIKKRIQQKKKGERWPLDLKKEILNIGFQLKREGWYWCDIAKELGCSREMLFEWKRKEDRRESKVKGKKGKYKGVHKENQREKIKNGYKNLLWIPGY